jgi:hypothetical protein
MWEEVPHDVGKARERELTSISPKPALDKGAQMVRHHNTEQSAHDVIRRIMNNRTLVLQIQRELVDERKDITHTAAGESVNVELTEETKRHEAAFNLVREEMMRTLQEKHEEARRVSEEETRSLQEESEEIYLEYPGTGVGRDEDAAYT